jgi:mono/diheme cytochrome c family protein
MTRPRVAGAYFRMISARMSRSAKVLLTSGALIAVAALATGCGTEHIGVASSNPLHQGAVLFNQRCGGCHTLSYAATEGSAANTRSAQYNNGPNFNIRCERPVTRVLYAIENGGFSGSIMPQNVVVGQQAIEVAKFVATYAGRQAPKIPGATQCIQESVGTIPATIQTATTASATSTTATIASATTTTAKTATAGTAAPARKKPNTAHP